MPFVNPKYERQAATESLSMPRSESWESYGFMDSFASGIGEVFDEELSVSRFLNLEGYEERRATVNEMIKSGEINNPGSYRHPRKGFDYDRLANDMQDDRIQTDEKIKERRNKILASRRAYRRKVEENPGDWGSFGFMAGKMTGLIADPVNIATMPFGYAAATTKGLSLLARAARVGAFEAGVSAISESLIQPMVFSHKRDIESPYTARESIENIAMAAGGAGVLGFAGNGIAGYLGKIYEGRKALKDKALSIPDDVSDKIFESSKRMESSINRARTPIDIDAEKEALIQRWKEELTSSSAMRISDSEEKKLRNDLVLNIKRMNELKDISPEDIDDVRIEPKKGKGIPARKAKKDASDLQSMSRAEKAESLNEEISKQRIDIKVQLDSINQRLQGSIEAKRAKANLEKIDQGIMPRGLKEKIDDLESQRIDPESMTHEELIELDKEVLTKLEESRASADTPKRKYSNYESKKESSISGQGRAREIFTEGDVVDPEDISRYAGEVELTPIKVGDEIVVAKDIIEEIDFDINALNEVHGCLKSG